MQGGIKAVISLFNVCLRLVVVNGERKVIHVEDFNVQDKKGSLDIEKDKK